MASSNVAIRSVIAPTVVFRNRAEGVCHVPTDRRATLDREGARSDSADSRRRESSGHSTLLRFLSLGSLSVRLGVQPGPAARSESVTVRFPRPSRAADAAERPEHAASFRIG